MTGSFRLHRNGADNSAQRRALRSSGRRQPAPVTVTRPDPDAWALALRLANGDAKRLRVVSPVEIIVANRSRDSKGKGDYQ
jgi:uncharacterized protein YcaQ